MTHLVNAATALGEVSAASDPERPVGLAESRAMRLHTNRHGPGRTQRPHVLLMCPRIMADGGGSRSSGPPHTIVAVAQGGSGDTARTLQSLQRPTAAAPSHTATRP
jgi:hypothetical protein